MNVNPPTSVPRRWRDIDSQDALEAWPPGSSGHSKPFRLLVFFLLLTSLLVGLGYWVRPLPHPFFVPLWIARYADTALPTPAWTGQDRDALIQGNYFKHVAATTTSEQAQSDIRQTLSTLQARSTSESIVVYLSGLARTDAAGAVQVLPADASLDDPATWLPLAVVLESLHLCPARHKLLVLDILWPLANVARGVLADDVAGRVHADLEAVTDPRRLVLCTCSPGQVTLGAQALGRSVFGYYFEEGLRGWADGYGPEGSHDGRVSVRELADFVRDHVDRWSRLNGDARQTPLLTGAGADFPLVVLEGGQPQPHLSLAAEVAYPAWLQEAWKDVGPGGPHRPASPFLSHEMDQALLDAEWSWRGGVNPDQVRQNLQDRLNSLRQQAARVPPRPPPYSLALAAAGGEKPDEALTEAVATWLSQAEGQTRNLPLDKAEEARGKLVAMSGETLKAKSAFALAWAVFEAAVSDPSPTPERIRLLDSLLRARQPQPLFVETVFLHRLAAVAGTGSVWPTPFTSQAAAPLPGWIVHQALQVVHRGERAASHPSAFLSVRPLLDSAAQRRHDAEVVFEAWDYAPLEQAVLLWKQAVAEYDTVLFLEESVAAAHSALDEATSLLTALAPGLQDWPALAPAWAAVARNAQQLADVLAAQHRGTGILQNEGDVRQEMEQLRDRLAALRQSLSSERATVLIRQAHQANAAAAVAVDIDRLLRLPFAKAEERVALWQARYGLSRRLAEDTLRLDEDTPPQPAESVDTATAERDVQQAGIARAERALSLVNLLASAPQDMKELQGLITKLASDPTRMYPSGVVLRQTWTRLQRERSEGPSPAERDERILWGWLADRCRYEARERAALSRADLVWQFYSRAAQQYARQGQGLVEESYVRIDERSALPTLLPGQPVVETLDVRPSSPKGPAPRVQVEVLTRDDTWLTVLPRSAALPLKGGVSPDGAYLLSLAVTLRPAAERSTPPPAGFLLRVRLQDRDFHYRVNLPLVPQRPQVLIAANPDTPAPALADLRLRPVKVAQPFYVYVSNPTSQEWKSLTVRMSAGGAIFATAQPFPLPPGGVQRVAFIRSGPLAPVVPPPSPEKAVAPDLELTRLTGPLDLAVLDAGENNRLLTNRLVHVDIASPREYVSITEARFVPPTQPAVKNRLTVGLRAKYPLTPPPCTAELILPTSPAGAVGFQDGTLRGVVAPDGSELRLYAENLRTPPGGAPARFALTIDAFARAFIFRSTFPSQGDTVTPSLDDEPGVHLRVSGYGKSGPGYRAGVEVDNAPEGASLEVSLGRLQGGAFVPEIVTRRSPARKHAIGFNPLGPGGALLFTATVEDEDVLLDTSDVRGPRQLQAVLLDAEGRELARDMLAVILAANPPGGVRIIDPPARAWRGAPLPLQAVGGDPVAGVKEVVFFVGRPVDGKIPPNTTTIPATPLDAERTTWGVKLPLPPDRVGPVPISVQFVNGIGLSSFDTVLVDLTETDFTKTAPGSIKGRVMEGDLPQAGLVVVLTDERGAERARETTGPGGTFQFKGVPPGKYRLSTSKVGSNRIGVYPRKVGEFLILLPGATVEADLPLHL
jgi:hypothetical protein